MHTWASLNTPPGRRKAVEKIFLSHVSFRRANAWAFIHFIGQNINSFWPLKLKKKKNAQALKAPNSNARLDTFRYIRRILCSNAALLNRQVMSFLSAT